MAGQTSTFNAGAVGIAEDSYTEKPCALEFRTHSGTPTSTSGITIRMDNQMTHTNRYKKRANQYVVAVQINLELKGGKLSYWKWDDEQVAKRGDWLVNNGGDVYTIDAESFAKTYEDAIPYSPGHYVKVGTVWATETTSDGSVETKEGRTHYKAGDYLVSNNEDGSDGYCIGREKFREMYELA